ncbi:MAG: hypothetical protein Q8922_02645 [Bacteroidota bacterium]|nr:hypothetical protein [Bacteroidota bacterium]MDP4234735.1 hypothetical protein [Bacteroidota bacterium]MDP4242627.1 hypothetical protein [Bacteroidota bacterium]MDP4286811.1 hypothetical protein [Bacteroidota bacterium]
MRRLTSYAAILLLALLLLPEVSLAQCPGSTGPAPDPALGCGWISATSYQKMGSTNCWATVHFCWRNCPGWGLEVWVYQVDPDATNDCNDLSPVQLIWYAKDAADLAALGANGSTPPCDPPTLQITSYIPGCWKATNVSSQGRSYVICDALAGCYCQKSCQVCWNGGWVFSNCASVGPTGCACVDSPAPEVASAWILETCYSVPCQP